jgi:Tfp pilus assembly protein PilF
MSKLHLPVLAVLALGCASTGGGAQEVAQHKSRTHYDMGSNHLAAGRTALALREYLAAERITPDDPWIHHGLAEAYRRKGRLEEAESHLRRALELRPDFHEAMLNLSALYIQMERYEESAGLADRLVADPTFPAPWRAYTNLGWAQYKLGRQAESRQALRSAIDHHPSYWPALLDLGILEAEAGRPLEALALFQRVLEIAPGAAPEAEANYRVAEIHVRLGNRDEAVRHLMAAADGPPRSPWVKQSGDYLKLLQ